jgi:hypothetical protein
MAVILTASPATKTAGTFGAALTVLNTGIWHFQFTPTAASSSYVGGNFHGLIVQDHGGIWLVDATLTFFNFADGTAFTRALTWSALQTIDCTVDTRSGTRSVTIAGATTGNGTQTFTDPGPYFDGGIDLHLGNYAAPFQFVGTLSDVDDTAAPSTSRSVALTIAIGAATSATRNLVRTAAMTVAVGATTAAVPVRVRTAAMSIAVGASTAATVVPAGGTSRTVAMTISVDASTAATRNVVRSSAMTVAVGASTAATVNRQRSASMPIAVGASTAATVAGAVSFGPGVSTSGLWTFGHSAAVCTIPGGYLPPGGGGADADGRTPPASITTEVSGSAFYIAVARPVATADKTFSDSKGNTYTSLAIGDYGVTSPWESQVALVLNGAGGAAHTLTANSIVNDETTLGFSEIKKCSYLADFATAFTADGSTQISPAGVDLKGPGWVYVDWFGDGPVTGAEGAVWTVTAVDEGATVGSQWQVVDSRIVNHTDGWIQWKRWRRYYATATTGIRLQLATLSVPQGARWYAAALMEANITLAAASLVIAVNAVTAATRNLARSASLPIAIGASTAATRSIGRTAAMAVAVDASTSAVVSRSRSASMTLAVNAVTSAVVARTRTAAMTVAVGASVAATANRSRSAALSIAVGASTAATVVPGGAGVQRSASMTIAVDAASAASLRAFRSASMAISVGAATSATVPGQAVLAPPDFPASLAISVVGAAPFRMEVV